MRDSEIKKHCQSEGGCLKTKRKGEDNVKTIYVWNIPGRNRRTNGNDT